MHPHVCASGRTSKRGSTTSRSGYMAADARVEVSRQAREETQDARHVQKHRVVRGLALRREFGGHGQDSLVLLVVLMPEKILVELESEAAADEKINKKLKC